MPPEFPRTLIEHQSPAGPMVVQVRGSLLVSSLQTLRELGLYERYHAHLPVALHEPIVYALAASWQPAELAMAHYAACDAMELGDKDFERIGEHVAARIMGTFVTTLVRGAQLAGAGMRPTLVLQNYHRLWGRLLNGGGCTVRQTGPKDAIIESRGVPMFRYRYFQLAYSHLVRGAGLISRDTIYTRVLRSKDANALTLSISWV